MTTTSTTTMMMMVTMKTTMLDEDASSTVGAGIITDDLIVVGVDNTDERIFEYTYSQVRASAFTLVETDCAAQDPSTPGGGGADLYLDFLVAQVIPTVRKHFRVSASARLGILGSSLGSSVDDAARHVFSSRGPGGLVSCYAIWRRADVFSSAGCMSSSFWWNNEVRRPDSMLAHWLAHHSTPP
jgi:predicted alpha/beta superfamily hydrolase